MITEKKSELGEFKDFLKNVCPLYVIDHAGRAGNGFFQTLFDEHPEVLSIPWIHYCTSYFITQFGDAAKVNSRKAHDFWTQKSYFRLLYSDLNDEDYKLVHRFGGDPDTTINREMIRAIFDQLVLQNNTISRKDVIFASFFAFARAFNRDISKIKYLILTDSISLRKENVFRGFSGKIIDISIKDSSKARFIHLVRDPRAGFASTNHQFVNQLGNTYAIRLGNIPQRFMELLRCEFSMEGPFVFGFWILYFLETFRSIEKKKETRPDRFLTIRNEDLNLRFVPTIKKLTQDLELSFIPIWEKPEYCPTMLGQKWKGTGGYSNRYQIKRSGPLQNDPDEVSSKVVGPNEYVTKRWKKRLSNNEIDLLEYFFRDELKAYKYEFLKPNPLNKTGFSIWFSMVHPLRGEVPPLKWLYFGWHQNLREFVDRLSYYIALPIFMISSRVVFLLSNKTRRVLFYRKNSYNI
jgi:hypothetical protein